MRGFELGLAGKVAIVTGASEGLGRATSERLARFGAHVVMAARRPDVLAKAAAEIRVGDPAASVVDKATDVTRASDIEALVALARSTFGGVDILVNNAGASAAAGLEQVSDEAWQADWELKVMAAVRTSRAVVASMRERGGGSIVNVTTPGGKAPGSGALPTSVTRAAGINLTKSLATEYAHDNIRVNTILIGVVKSAQWERRFAGDDHRARYADLARSRAIPLGRVGDAEEFADLVAFLVSDRAKFITGAGINFDGGESPVV